MKKYCFVAMPFSEVFLSYYENIYKIAIYESGFSPIIIKDVESTRAIINDIFEAIVKSDIVLTDVSNLNPNVLYELGIAHALKKPTILIKEKKSEFPFDINHLRHIIYDTSNVRWDYLLKEKIKSTILTIKSSLNKNLAWDGGVNINSYVNEELQNHLHRTYELQEGDITCEEYVNVNEKGNTTIKHECHQYAETNISHQIIQFFTDDPGETQVLEVFDEGLKRNLDFSILSKTETSIKICIYFNPIKQEKTAFHYSIKLDFESYFSKLIHEKYASFRFHRMGKIKLKHKMDYYKFPLNDNFKKLKCYFLKHPNKEQVSKIIFPKTESEHQTFYIDYGETDIDNVDYIIKFEFE